MDAKTGSIEGGCPMGQGDGGVRALLGRTNKDWWPEMLATEILNPNGPSNPMGEDFDYAEMAARGGLQKAWNLFGKELDRLMDEMNEELVA